MLGLPLTLALALAPPTPLSPPTPPAEIVLTWEAPEGCPTGDEVIERYRQLLTTAPNGEGIMLAEAEIVAVGEDLWRLDLVTRMSDVTDVRKLRATRCADLAEATAVLFAVALEPTLEPTLEPSEFAQAKTPTTLDEQASEGTGLVELEPDTEASASDAAARVVETTPPATEPEPEPAPRPLFLTLAAGVEAGAVPGFTARTAVGMGYVWRWARIEGDLVWYAPRARIGDFGPVTVQVAGTTLRGCGVPGTRRWQFPVCLGFEAGATIARESRAEGRRIEVGRWFTPLLRASAVHQWRRLGGFVAVEGAGPLLGRTTRVDDRQIFEPAAASGRAVVGLEVYFF